MPSALDAQRAPLPLPACGGAGKSFAQTFEESLKASGLPMGALDLALLQRLLEKVIDDNTVQLPTSCDAPTLN